MSYHVLASAFVPRHRRVTDHSGETLVAYRLHYTTPVPDDIGVESAILKARNDAIKVFTHFSHL